MDEKYFDLASKLATDRVNDALQRSRDAMTGPGTNECITCGCDISPERKQAMPSAMRCVRCESIFERKGK
jgi:RNA polymerase-binding transcription factor DksA